MIEPKTTAAVAGTAAHTERATCRAEYTHLCQPAIGRGDDYSAHGGLIHFLLADHH